MNENVKEVQSRLFAGVDPDTPVDQIPQTVKDRLFAIVWQLFQSHRVCELLKNNITIVDRIDPDSKTIETLVVENPVSVGPPLTSGQVVELQTLLKIAGCKSPDKIFQSVMKIFGQEGPTVHLGGS